MPRAPKESDLSSPTARRRLKPKSNRTPYWRALGEGRFLGFRPSPVGPGTWVARLYLDGKYLEGALATADDRTAANGSDILDHRAAVDAALAWCHAAAAPATPRCKYTIADAVRDYLDWYRSHRKAYRDAERRLSELLPLFGNDTFESLTTERLRRWHQGLATAPARLRPGRDRQKVREISDDPESIRRRRASANRNLAALRAILNFAVTEDRVPASAANIWKPVRPFREVDRPRIRHFDREEVRWLLNGCESDFRRLVSGALLTGARYGELIHLRVEDFRQQETAGYIIVEGKTGRRTIYLNEEGIAFFRSLTAGRDPDARMFVRADGLPWQRSHQGRRMADAARSAKIPHPASFHILRHTYASTYLMAGGSLEGLARQLGHSDTRMTMRSYAHLAEGWRAQEAQVHAPRFGLAPDEVNVVRMRAQTS